MNQGDDFRVVVFSDTLFETNGIASFYKTVLAWCRKNGPRRVTVLCPARDDLRPEPIDDNVVAVRALLQYRNPFYRDLTLGLYGQAQVRELVQSIEGPKVIHVASSGSLGVAGAKVARKLKLPLVGCYHTDLPHYSRLYGRSLLGPPGGWLGARVGRACDRRAYGRCLAICAPSPTAAETVKSFYRGPIEVIPNPVDVQRFHPGASRGGGFRQRYCRDGRVLAVVVGRVAREKNLDLVCELLGADDRIDLVFVGDGPYSATLRQRWHATVTGFLHGQELLDAYQQADVFVHLSVTETFGLSLVEAMASGLPVVALRSPGFLHRIPPGSGVEVIEQHELPSLADRCVALVADPQRHQESAHKVRALVEQLGADAVLPKFMEFHRPFAG